LRNLEGIGQLIIKILLYICSVFEAMWLLIWRRNMGERFWSIPKFVIVLACLSAFFALPSQRGTLKFGLYSFGGSQTQSDRMNLKVLAKTIQNYKSDKKVLPKNFDDLAAAYYGTDNVSPAEDLNFMKNFKNIYYAPATEENAVIACATNDGVTNILYANGNLTQLSSTSNLETTLNNSVLYKQVKNIIKNNTVLNNYFVSLGFAALLLFLGLINMSEIFKRNSKGFDWHSRYEGGIQKKLHIALFFITIRGYLNRFFQIDLLLGEKLRFALKNIRTFGQIAPICYFALQNTFASTGPIT